jgi:AraC-like DNA-binding protein
VHAVLVLNTESLPPAERADAFQASVSQNCTTSLATFEDPRAVRAELTVFDLGPAKVFNIVSTGNTLRRTPQMSRAMNECPIALALPMRTDNHLQRGREERSFGPRDMILVDLSAPYVYGWEGEGASYAFHVEFDMLGLPMETIQAAAHRLESSPLYPLVRDHIAHVTADAHLIAETPAAFHVGAASVDMMHALIVSAADDRRHLEASMRASESARVQAYVRTHLRDHDLTPAKIARANGMSIRALYQLYESLGVSLERSIIEQRLDGARTDLAAPRQRYDSIAATARAWGFSNPSFFTSRFRQSFGLSPREWRAKTRPNTSGGA